MTASTAPLSLAGTPAASALGYSSWMLGQAAREPLYVMVAIYIFFPYFSNVVVGNPVQGQALIGFLSASSGIFMALTVPFLGAIADKNGRRKPWIILSYSVLCVAGISLWWILPDDGGLGVTWGSALIFIFLIAFGYTEVFHNAMLPSVAPADKTGLISGIGFSIANLVSIMLLLFVLFAFALPGTVDWAFLPSQALFGVDTSVNGHDRIVGPLGGVWLFLAILPLLLFTPDGEPSKRPLSEDVREGLKDVMTTIRQLKHYSNIGRYLLARMFFNDGMVGVVIFGGVYASSTFGWDTTAMLIFGLCTTISAMFGVFLGGFLDDRFGSLATLKIAISSMIMIMLILVSIQPDTLFYIVHVSEEAVWSSPYFSSLAELVYFLAFVVFAPLFLIALSASRTLMARISPAEKVTQFYGLYSLSGSVTAFLAPLLVGLMTTFFQSQRVGFASLIVLMMIGGVILLKVKQQRVMVADIHE